MDSTQKLNITSRSKGAVGPNAIVPKYIAAIAKPGDAILDYGAGKDAIHTKWLKSLGFDVTAYDIGSNEHDIKALDHKYDIVFGSNVLNVQASKIDLILTIIEMRMVSYRLVIVNYPESPRYAGLSTKYIRNLLWDMFSLVGNPEKNIYRCVK